MARADAQSHIMERLLEDPAFRARFRRDPAGVAREEGDDALANELASIGDPMQTLDFRESRSSVAGVMMAAAVEGLGIYELGRQVFGHVEEAQAATGGGGSQHGGGSHGWDPDQFGTQGTGGRPSEETLALLENKNVRFDASGIADLKSGRMDPRVVSVLGAISERHRITISTTASDHPRLTAGGSVSNHFYGRAFDIATVDGKPVNSGNGAARKLALQLSRMDPRIRPSEIGSPWALPGAAYFTDAAHQNHVHVGFDDPIDAGWAPPGGTAEPAPADDLPPDEAANGSGAAAPLADPSAAGADLDDEDSDSDEEDSDEEDSDEEDSDEEDEDENESDSWDETHESGSDEDAGGSGDDGSSESGSDEDAGGTSDDDSDSDGDSGSGDGSDGDSAPGDSPPLDDGLQVPDPGGYPGDDATQDKMAAWMASAAQKRGLPPELPVMASLVESGMKNLSGGDADSVGFFQMRVSIWNKGAYGGYPDRPELQLRWFLDHAAAVKKERLARGLPVDDPRHYGDWIADVENPAAQYRGRYQLRWEEAHELLKKAGARRGGDGALDLVDSGGGAHAGRRALTALAAARKELGTPYRWGGSSPKAGFDCSGLVQWAYAKAGIRIPRVSEQQILAANGTPVSRKHLLPGDLVFFRDSTGDVHHVGISLGGDKFINAPHTGDVVKIASLKEPYYAQQFTGGRRFDRAVSGVQEARAESGGAQGRDAEAAAVRLARAALERDAAEVNRSNSALFRALERQEWGKGNTNEVQFLRAVPAPAQQP